MVSSPRHRPYAQSLIPGAMCLALAGCQRAPDTKVAAQAGTASSTPAAAGATLGIRPDGDTESTIDMSRIQDDDFREARRHLPLQLRGQEPPGQAGLQRVR